MFVYSESLRVKKVAEFLKKRHTHREAFASRILSGSERRTDVRSDFQAEI